uniref:Uncharacterized protein n=1 Tax=viral metagenome TaxID=1070528 RepID=A0A6C0F5V5_9ZZZZ|tara:strand:- start:17649 stop:17960 length:312 start_codon:yes stop_codon:yes gene_type:complete
MAKCITCNNDDCLGICLHLKNTKGRMMFFSMCKHCVKSFVTLPHKALVNSCSYCYKSSNVQSWCLGSNKILLCPSCANWFHEQIVQKETLPINWEMINSDDSE